jgi:hypothetical protein
MEEFLKLSPSETSSKAIHPNSMQSVRVIHLPLTQYQRYWEEATAASKDRANPLPTFGFTDQNRGVIVLPTTTAEASSADRYTTRGTK